MVSSASSGPPDAIQVREYGVPLDQIVLSSWQYLASRQVL
jgi:hypothetical protein